MNITRVVGFGTICVSVGLGAWACQEDATSGTPLSPDGGQVVPGLDGSAGDGAVKIPEWCGDVDGGVQSRCAKGQWDDRPEGDAAAPAPNCKACPGRALTCADLVKRIDG